MREDDARHLVRELQAPRAQERHEQRGVQDARVVERRGAQPRDLERDGDGEREQEEQGGEWAFVGGDARGPDVDAAVRGGGGVVSGGGRWVGGEGYLVKMLKAMPNPPKTMKASFRPSLGMYCRTMGYRSSLVSARNSVSQNWGPKVYC